MPRDVLTLEIEEDLQIPIILRCPFLTTVRAIIDIKRDKILLEIKDDKVEFDVFKMVKQPLMVNL